jgi:hypothetical protein
LESIDATLHTDSVVNTIANLRDLLSEFSSDSHSRVSEPFLNGVASVIRAVEVFFQCRLKAINKSGAQKELRQEETQFLCQICLQLLINIHQNYLPLLYASKQNNEYLILPSITRAVGKYHAGVELTLLPEFRFNYTYNGGLEDFVNQTVEKLEKQLDDESKGSVRAAVTSATPRWITFIHFPLAHRDSALNLVVLFHEVGHLIDQTGQLFHKFLPIKLVKTVFEEELEKLCTLPSPAKKGNNPAGSQLTFESFWGRDHIKANFTRQCIATVESWVRELIADFIAIRMVGPAYLFSFSQLAAHGEIGQPSLTHPAPIYRIFLMLEELHEMGYFEGTPDREVRSQSNAAVSSALGIEPILSDLMLNVQRDLVAKKLEELNLVAQATIEKLVPQLRATMRTFTSGNEYNYSQYADEVPEVMKLLLRGIAPVEIPRKGVNDLIPAGVTAIVNAGWQLYKTRILDFYGLFRPGIPESKRLKSLNQLLFKAVEASEVVLQWKKNSIPPR